MKKLILTSSGFLIPSVRSIILEHLPSQRPLKVAYISTASKVVKDDTYARRDVEIMNELNFDVTEIDLAEVDSDYLRDALPQHDVLYVQGGNGFYLLLHARRSGFMNIAKPLIEDGSLVYVGKSAGTYLACPTIEMHTWSDKDWRRFGVEDFTAMNLVPFLIKAHYSPEKEPETLKGMERCPYPLWAISNEEAILVQGDETTSLGEGKAVYLNAGQG